MFNLKPCPFCGKEIKRYSIGTFNGYDVYELKISCCMEFDITSDELLFADGDPLKLGLDAVEKWNKRAGEQKEEAET